MPKRRVGTRLVRAGMLALLFPVVWAETAKPKVEAGPLCHWSWRAAGHDANGGWSPRVAIQTIRRLYEHGIYFVEQPVPALDAAWMADVRSQVQVPIMADESVSTLQDAMARCAQEPPMCCRYMWATMAASARPEKSPRWLKARVSLARWAVIWRWASPARP
jgi:hypothetical protein